MRIKPIKLLRKNFTLTQEQADRLCTLAMHDGRTESDHVRLALDEYFDARHPLWKKRKVRKR